MIDSMYVFISVKNGSEGVMMFKDPTGKITPMISCDLSEVQNLKIVAEKIRKENGIKVSLVHFTNRTVIEEI